MGIAERKQKEKEARRESILNAAKKVFLERGFAGATIEAIAQEAELSPAAIYLYFMSKDELYASLNLETASSFERAVIRIAALSDLSPERKLDRVWEAMYDIFCCDPLALRALLHTHIEGTIPLLSDPLRASLDESGKNAIDALASIVREGIDRGDFLPGHAMATADALWGLFTGLVVWEGAKRMHDDKKDYLMSTLRAGYETFKRGLRSKADNR
jgi:AcrR family transcriptional regulator